MNTVKCPTCSKIVEWDPQHTWRPFCSERCKLIDLGEWASESHRISGNLDENFTVADKDKKTEV